MVTKRVFSVLILSFLLSCDTESIIERPADVYTEINDEGETVVSERSDNIVQTTQSFEVPGHIAPTQRWTMRINGLCGQSCKNGPRHMYTGSFADTLFVSWMSVDEKDPWQQYGNVATFQVSPEGKFTLKSNVNLSSKCEATYGFATKSDGSIIAVLCRGYVDAKILPDAINLLDTKRTANCKEDWEGRCYPIGHFSGLDSPLYIFEYHGGKITENPDKIVLINRAVGGWRYGHHELSLNEAEDTYFVHLKVTAGPSATNRHEGLTHFAVRRSPNFEYVSVTDGWGCGAGHVQANRLAYNRATDTWSQLCTLDSCPNYDMFENRQCLGISWYTVPGVTREPSVEYKGDYLLELDHTEKNWNLSGGGFALLSLGADGYLALAAGPGYSTAQTKPDTLGLMRLPLTIPELQQTAITEQATIYEGGAVVGQKEITRYQWNWLYLPDIDPELGRTKRFGMGNMAYFSKDGEASQRLLLGWSPSIEFQGITSEYLVSEIDREGNLRGAPFTLKDAGWGEDNLWVTMPNSGCVVFPFAWVGDGPGKSYPDEKNGRLAADYPTTMHLTSLCPASDTQPPLTETPLPLSDAERWPPASE